MKGSFDDKKATEREKTEMGFSLINVSIDEGATIDGYWIQNVTDTLEKAKQLAREIEEVNGFRIRIAVVDELSSTVPILGYWKKLKRLG